MKQATPQDISDRHLTGLCLLRGSVGAVSPEWVSNPRLREVLVAMRELEGLGLDPDFSALAQRAGVSVATLAALVQAVPTAVNAEHWEWEARRLYRQREMGAALRELARRDSLSDAEIQVFAERFAGTADDGDRLVPLRDLLRGVVKQLESDAPTGLSTGFEAIDGKIGLMAPGQLWVLGARPGMGKSALASDIARHVGAGGGRVVFVNLEMGAELLAQRLVAAQGRVPTTRIRTRSLRDADWARLTRSVSELDSVEFYSFDRPELARIVQALRAEHRRKPLDLVVVDYLQLMTAGDGKHREREVATMSRALKTLALRCGFPVLALSQLNRSLESRSDKRPALSDLRESGAVEQDADVVLFVYREGYYAGSDGRDAEPAEIICAKNRTGPAGTVLLDWYGETQTFRDPKKYTYGG